MKRCLALFALSFAIVVGLMPATALAAEGGALAAALAVEDGASAVQPAPITTQVSGGTYGTLEVVGGPTFIGPKCSVTFRASPSLIVG